MSRERGPEDRRIAAPREQVVAETQVFGLVERLVEGRTQDQQRHERECGHGDDHSCGGPLRASGVIHGASLGKRQGDAGRTRPVGTMAA